MIRRHHGLSRSTSRKGRRRAKAAALLCVVATLSAACSSSSAGSSAGTGSGKAGGTLRVAVATDFDLLDPHKAALETFLVFFPLVYDSLLAVDKNGDPAPGLAESWDIAPDGLTYTFHLRDGAKWHDGTPFQASDVVWNINRILNPDTASIRAVYFKNVSKVEDTDPRTVVFHMSARDASLLAYLATQGGLSMVNPKDVDAKGNVIKHIGTGPFTWKSYTTGKFVAARNPDYWNGAPKLDSVEVLTIKDPQARLQALQSGQVDFNYDLDASDGANASDKGGFKAQPNPQNRLDFVAFNSKKAPFDNIAVRQALCLSLNRTELAKAAWNGYATVTDQFFDKDSYWHIDQALNNPAEGDLAKAKELLASAGFKGFSGNLVDAQGEPGLGLETQTIVSAWSDLGVKVKISTVDTPTFVEQVRGGKYDIIHMYLGFIPDPGRPFGLMTTASTGHAYFGFVANANTDKLIAAVQGATEKGQRKDAVEALVKDYLSMSGFCPLLNPTSYVGIGDKVHDYEQGATYVKYAGGNDITHMTLG